jgi:hypothetical protein
VVVEVVAFVVVVVVFVVTVVVEGEIISSISLWAQSN